MLDGQKILQDVSKLINRSMYQIPSIFGSEFYSIIMIIQYQVILVLTKLKH